MVTDPVGGTLDVMFAGPAGVAGQIRPGRVRALATTDVQRSPGSPTLPTVAEAGLPGHEFALWHVLSARSGTPAAILASEAVQTRCHPPATINVGAGKPDSSRKRPAFRGSAGIPE